LKNIFFLGLMLLSSVHISAGEAELAIIIDLDRSETATSSNIIVTQSLALALLSERCPIITNRSLLQAIFDRAERFLNGYIQLKPENTSLYDWVSKSSAFNNQTKIDLLCTLIKLEEPAVEAEPKKEPFWSVYADTDSPLVYLIPQTYLSSKGITLPGKKVDSLKDLFKEPKPAKPDGRDIARKIMGFFSPLSPLLMLRKIHHQHQLP